MRTPTTPFEFGALFECRTTTTVLVSALTLSVLRFTGSDFLSLVAAPDTWYAQPWTLITTTLLHGNILHLVFNLYWLAMFGVAVETAFGLFPTAGLFVLFALGSSAPEVALVGGGIGLSGVGYGLFGFLWSLGRWDQRYRGCIDSRTTQLFVVWFFVCILLTVTDVMAIGNVAHGAGAIVGAATGWAVARNSRGTFARFLPLFLTLAAIGAACTIAPPYAGNREMREYAKELERSRVFESGNSALAERLYEEAVQADGADWRAWWNLGVVRWRMEKREEALVAFEKSAKLHAPSPTNAAFLEEVRAWRARNSAQSR